MSVDDNQPALKPLAWVGSSKADLIRFPVSVRKEMGYALYLAQTGEKAPAAKPLRGFGGAGVLEVVENHDGNVYRAVYTVRFAEVVYVLHAFQKKSTRGNSTRQTDIELIRRRLKAAAEQHRQDFGE